MLHVDLSSRIRSRPPCHSESASAVPIYAALHIVIPNPLQRCHIRGPAHCHSESASAVRNLLFPPVVSRKRGVPRVSPLFRPGIPALIETDSYQGTPSGVPPRTHPAGPRPSGATAIARSSALLSSNPVSAWRRSLQVVLHVPWSEISETCSRPRFATAVQCQRSRRLSMH